MKKYLYLWIDGHIPLHEFNKTPDTFSLISELNFLQNMIFRINGKMIF